MPKARLFGLIGKKLGHSFSEKYFTEKFEKEGLNDCTYKLFELDNAAHIVQLVAQHPNIEGLNVTVPYKEDLFSFLDTLDPTAQKVKAVNVIKISQKQWIGHNTDYYGFMQSLTNWLPSTRKLRALILGTGGASKAVQAVLQDLAISFHLVSRNPAPNVLTYQQLNINPQTISENRLIINTTPLGMSPDILTYPDLPYQNIGSSHFIYDLVYNPKVTQLMKRASAKGAQVKNGLEMLHLQAERSWEIWNG